MAKTGKKPQQHKGKSGRPAPYPQKALVEVTFENGSSGGSSSKPPAQVVEAVKVEEPEVTVSTSTASAASLNKGKGKAVDQSQSTIVSAGTFVVVAGSYEKLLYGLEGSLPSSTSSTSSSQRTVDAEGDSNTELNPIFIFPAHLACVKAVAASPGGKWLATGSEDEFVKVWDLRRRREMGSLSQHTGSITSLYFPSSSHLISTSVDGTIALFRTSDWACLKALKGHSGRVNHVDVHPTGRVALSVGKDNTLRMWDLMRGRGAASLALGTEAEIVKFSPLGTHFAVLFPKKIEIYSLTLRLLHRIETKSRFNTLEFTLIPATAEDAEDTQEREVLCVGTEKGIVEIRSVVIGDEEERASGEEGEDDEADASEKEKKPTGGAKLEMLVNLVGHRNRIKSLSTLSQPILASNGSIAGKAVLLSTVSSDGYINLYNLSSAVSRTPVDGDDIPKVSPIAAYDTKGSRLTCVFLADGKKAQLSTTSGSDGVVPKAEAVTKTEGESGGMDMDDDEDDDEDDDDDEEGEEMYDQGSEDGSEDGEGLDGVEVEFEDEEEEEEEEEGEEED